MNGCRDGHETIVDTTQQRRVIMEKSWEARVEKLRRMYDKTYETGAWTGIVLSRMLLNVMPSPIRKRMERPVLHFDDRRHDRRLHVDRSVTCMKDGQETENAHLINISIGGMYVEMDNPSDVGQELFFNITGRNLGQIMRVKGRVMRRSERGMAIQFS